MLELAHPLDAIPEHSPLAEARERRDLTVKQVAYRSGLTEEEIEWLEDGRLYRFPSQSAAALAAVLYATGLGIDRYEARRLAGPTAHGVLPRQRPRATDRRQRRCGAPVGAGRHGAHTELEPHARRAPSRRSRTQASCRPGSCTSRSRTAMGTSAGRAPSPAASAPWVTRSRRSDAPTASTTRPRPSTTARADRTSAAARPPAFGGLTGSTGPRRAATARGRRPRDRRVAVVDSRRLRVERRPQRGRALPSAQPTSAR